MKIYFLFYSKNINTIDNSSSNTSIIFIGNIKNSICINISKHTEKKYKNYWRNKYSIIQCIFVLKKICAIKKILTNAFKANNQTHDISSVFINGLLVIN